MTEVAGKMAFVLEILGEIYYFRSMKKLLYVHGYNGSPDGGSCRLFKKHKPENWEVIGMDYCQDDCELALRQIRETIEREGIDVVVGCSLGGFLTLLTTGVRRFEVNPCYLPSVELPKLKPFEGFPAPSPELIATYAALEWRLKRLPEADRKNITALFGDSDELLGLKYRDMMADDLGILGGIVPSHHHISEEAVKLVCQMLSDERMKDAHRHSFENEEEIKASETCGCFSCCRTFAPNEIEDWVDDADGKTALCPYCHTDAVIGDASGLPLDKTFLHAMNLRWF